jgi:small subunit ribosomal protein S2
MRRALMFLAAATYKGSIIMFISSNRDTMHTVERMAAEVGEYAHTRKWEPSTLTNMKQLFDAPLRLPDVIIFLTVLSSTLTPHPAVIEAAKMAIPTIGIVDSNAGKLYLLLNISVLFRAQLYYLSYSGK